MKFFKIRNWIFKIIQFWVIFSKVSRYRKFQKNLKLFNICQIKVSENFDPIMKGGAILDKE